MDSAQVLRQLMRRIGLDREEVDERCRLLDWQARDGERLNQAALPSPRPSRLRPSMPAQRSETYSRSCSRCQSQRPSWAPRRARAKRASLSSRA